MAKTRNTVAKTTSVSVTPNDIIKKALFNGDEKHDAGVVSKLPKLGTIKSEGNFDAAVLTDSVLSSYKKVNLAAKDLQKANYADAALLAKAIATVQPEYIDAMALIIKDMVIETLTAVQAGLYTPKCKTGIVDDDYIARFVSRAKNIVKANARTIVAKGPYFVFGWVDDDSND